MAGLLMRAAAGAGERVMAAAWEFRRWRYQTGSAAPERVPARVVSVGNLTLGSTGKTTLTIHLTETARGRGRKSAVVCRRYAPGPGGRGDEELLLSASLPAGALHAGRSKLEAARSAAAAGHDLVIVDDGFSHWRLARDLDVVLLDSRDLFGGGRLLPAGRLREPLRALQRAGVVVITRLAPGEDPAPFVERARPYAPAAVFAAGRHRTIPPVRLATGEAAPAGRVWILSAVGNPGAVERSAREAGLEVAGGTTYLDHHWFTRSEIARARSAASAAGAGALLLTAKDAVRWPTDEPRDDVLILPVRWEWVMGGNTAEAMVFGGGGSPTAADGPASRSRA